MSMRLNSPQFATVACRVAQSEAKRDRLQRLQQYSTPLVRRQMNMLRKVAFVREKHNNKSQRDIKFRRALVLHLCNECNLVEKCRCVCCGVCCGWRLLECQIVTKHPLRNKYDLDTITNAQALT